MKNFFQFLHFFYLLSKVKKPEKPVIWFSEKGKREFDLMNEEVENKALTEGFNDLL